MVQLYAFANTYNTKLLDILLKKSIFHTKIRLKRDMFRLAFFYSKMTTSKCFLNKLMLNETS